MSILVCYSQGPHKFVYYFTVPPNRFLGLCASKLTYSIGDTGITFLAYAQLHKALSMR